MVFRRRRDLFSSNYSFQGVRCGRPPFGKRGGQGLTPPPAMFPRGAFTFFAPKYSMSFLPKLASLSSQLYGGKTRERAWPPARRSGSGSSALFIGLEVTPEGHLVLQPWLSMPSLPGFRGVDGGPIC